MSMVSSFHRFRGLDGFMVSCVFGFIGSVVSMFSWFHRFRGFKGLIVLIGFVVSMISWCQ